MHNLHLILIRAESAQEAADDALIQIQDWGNENNWRCVGGVASESGTDDIMNHDDGRWDLDYVSEYEGKTAFERLMNYHLKRIIDPIHLENLGTETFANFEAAKQALIQALQDFQIDKDPPFRMWRIKAEADYLYHLIDARRQLDSGTKIPTLYHYEFDETGLTDLTSDGDSEELGRYIVMLDMHS